MNKGRLEQLAEPAELYAHPATPFVADFVGLNNRVPATVSGGRASLLGLSLPAAQGSVDGEGVAMVRPESVSVTADPSGTATVTSVSFLGAISRVHLSAAEGAVLMAQMASSAARDLQPGERVAVAVDSDAVLVTPA